MLRLEDQFDTTLYLIIPATPILRVSVLTEKVPANNGYLKDKDWRSLDQAPDAFIIPIH